MFSETSIVNLFPIPVWVHKLPPEQARRINGAALALIERLRAERSDLPPNPQWQTPNDLQDRAELEELTGLVKAATGGILKHLQVEHGAFMITGCWANIMPGGSLPHGRHTHPNNYLSGVYYVQVPEGGDTIVFHDPKPQTNVIAPRIAVPNEYNSRNATLAVQTGSLIMFPAWLAHSVNPNEGATERISISFNVMFTQFAEEMSKPRWEFDPAALRTSG